MTLPREYLVLKNAILTWQWGGSIIVMERKDDANLTRIELERYNHCELLYHPVTRTLRK